MRISMYIRNHIVLLFCLGLCVSCGVKRSGRWSATEHRVDSLHFRHADSLHTRQLLRQEAAWQLEWREAVLSAPDSSGRQFVQTVRTATARSCAVKQQAVTVDTSHEKSLYQKNDSQATVSKNKNTISIPFIWTLLPLFFAFLAFFSYLNKK